MTTRERDKTITWKEWRSLLQTYVGVLPSEARLKKCNKTETGDHNVYFQQVQEDISKARSVNKDWEFVSKGTEISLGKFVTEYFTPLTLDLQTGVVSTEDTGEI
jgi:hypothetical protein